MQPLRVLSPRDRGAAQLSDPAGCLACHPIVRMDTDPMVIRELLTTCAILFAEISLAADQQQSLRLAIDTREAEPILVPRPSSIITISVEPASPFENLSDSLIKLLCHSTFAKEQLRLRALELYECPIQAPGVSLAHYEVGNKFRTESLLRNHPSTVAAMKMLHEQPRDIGKVPLQWSLVRGLLQNGLVRLDLRLNDLVPPNQESAERILREDSFSTSARELGQPRRFVTHGVKDRTVSCGPGHSLAPVGCP